MSLRYAIVDIPLRLIGIIESGGDSSAGESPGNVPHEDEAVKPLLLDFIDEQTEKKFIDEYDDKNRVFFRIAIYLSCLAWFIWYVGIYFSYHSVFAPALAVLLSVLLIPFIIVVTLSFNKKYSTLTHNIAAFCNFAAACVCIYVAVYLINDITFLVAGVICISFFCYFIIRIRFKVSFITTLSYAIIAQICVIFSGNFNNSQIYTSSSGIYLGFFIAMLAGYFFEKTNRKIFIQNKVIKEQQKELIIERNRIKQSLEELRVAQDQLVQQEKLASLGQLTAGIGHEIKNPLNFVNNFSELNVELIEEAREELSVFSHQLSERSSSEEAGDGGHVNQVLEILNDIETNLRKIHEHGSRADSIVKSMLEHSRGGSGIMEPTDLNALVREFVHLTFHGMRAGKNPINVDMEYDLDESIGEVPLVTEDFSRVIINLCNNAFDAMREKQNSEFRIRDSEEYKPKLTIRTHHQNSGISIEIEDNGSGVPDEMKDKILQPFFTTKKGTEGTGLGLSITNDIVKAHGGEIQLQSNPGKTVFVLTIAH